MKKMEEQTRSKAQRMLVEAGVKPSFQRLRILHAILEAHSHPSAEEIFQALKPEIPTLSRTTVYNTLNLLVEKDILLPLTISEHEIRYDACTDDEHSHFFCSCCGRILDIGRKPSCMPGQELEGHLVNKVRLYLTGVCRECREKG